MGEAKSAAATMKCGDLVIAIDAEGEELPRRVISERVKGDWGLPLIWVCREEEWHAAQHECRQPDGVPWPAEDVHHRRTGHG